HDGERTSAPAATETIGGQVAADPDQRNDVAGDLAIGELEIAGELAHQVAGAGTPIEIEPHDQVDTADRRTGRSAIRYGVLDVDRVRPSTAVSRSGRRIRGLGQRPTNGSQHS